jgi:DNA modification methylase
MGLEPTIAEYLEKMVTLFRELRRVLKSDGTCWLNLGDTYASFRDGKVAIQTMGNDQGGRPITGAQNRLANNFKESSIKSKDLCGIPWRSAFALQDDGWYLRQDIIWAKPNPMPESVTDRCTKSHEYIFLLTKNAKYFYDQEAIAEPLTRSSVERLNQPNLKDQEGSGRVPGKTNGKMKAVAKPSGTYNEDSGRNDGGTHPSGGYVTGATTRNKRSVWSVVTQPYSDAHFATFPPDLIKPCILAGSRPGDTILDPFGGSGTTGMVALELGRNAILTEINPDYVKLIRERTNITGGLGL